MFIKISFVETTEELAKYFYFKGLKDPFMNAKQFCNNQLPFSFADSRSHCEQTNLNDLEAGDRKYFR